MLFFLIAQIGHQQVGDIARAADGGAGVFGEEGQAVAELDGGFDLGGFGLAQAFDLGQLFQGGSGDAFDAAELGQQKFAQRDGAALAVADADQNGDQFRRGQRLRAVGMETFARAFFGRQFFDGRAVAVTGRQAMRQRRAAWLAAARRFRARAGGGIGRGAVSGGQPETRGGAEERGETSSMRRKPSSMTAGLDMKHYTRKRPRPILG